MNKTISPLVVGIAAMLLYTSNAYMLGGDRVAERDSWICILISSVIYIPIFLLFGYLTNKYPGRSLFQIMYDSLGKWGMKIIGLLYILYGAYVLGATLNCFASLVTSNILIGTPKIAMIVTIAVCTAFLAGKGTVAMGRWSSFILPFVLLFILLSLINSIPTLHLDYIKPIARSFENIVWGTERYMAFPFGEGILLFAFLPCVRGKFCLRNWFIPWFISALILSLTFMRNTMVLGGGLASVLSYTTNHVDGVSGYVNFTQHFEIVTSLIPAAGSVMGAAIALLFVSQGIEAVFGIKKEWINSIAGALSGVLCGIYFFPNNPVLDLNYRIWPFISVPFQITAPIICMVTGSLKSGVRRKLLARRLKRKIM